MKFKHIIILILAFINSNLLSQSNFYIGPLISYNFGIATKENNSYIKRDIDVIKSSDFSLGNGFSGGILIGYLLSDFIGIEANITYFKSNQITFNQILSIENNLVKNLDYSSMRFSPNILFNLALEPINPYAKLGLQFSKNNLTHTEQEMLNFLPNLFGLPNTRYF